MKPTVAQAPTAALRAAGFFHRHHLVLRRLHSLSGVVPIGVFLIEHLVTSSAILLGADEYQRDIDFI